ncbi:MAG: cation diffusion facilitator family transporter [Oscillospiraceae bacterium]
MDENKKMNDIINEDTENENLDLDSLESLLEDELDAEMSELEFLERDREQIGNPDALGETIKNVVWEQFINQIATTAGEDFIKENHGLTLDLRSEAHIQTTENFAKGKIVTHNFQVYKENDDGTKVYFKDEYQKRYDDWQSNFVKDSDGKVVMHDTRIPQRDANGNVILGSDGKPVKKQVETLVSEYRKPFDDVRKSRGLTGNREKGTAMDETVSVAEIIRDPAANAHMTQEERIEFDLSEKNLNEIDARWNSSKGDTPTNEWLDNTNSKGQKPQEIFDNMTDEDVEKLRQKDAEAREEYEKQKKDAEQRSIEAGKKSRKEEAFRIGGKALRAVVMQLLAELVKEIIGKLVKWFKDKNKSLDSFIESIKIAIKSFVSKLKDHLLNAGNTLITTIATAIIGPVVGTIKKVWMMLKQGWKSVKDAVAFLKNPENQNMPMSLKVLEIGKIVMAGLSGVGALVLGEVIEKGLMTIPAFAFEIPLIGSLANIIGVFMGAVVAGIIGAIVINLLDNATAKKRRELSTESQVDKGNEILKIQRELRDVAVARTEETVKNVSQIIKARHTEAGEIIKESVSEIFDSETTDHKVDFDEIDSALDGLLD